jgi:hypothetical protein
MVQFVDMLEGFFLRFLRRVFRFWAFRSTRGVRTGINSSGAAEGYSGKWGRHALYLHTRVESPRRKETSPRRCVKSPRSISGHVLHPHVMCSLLRESLVSGARSLPAMCLLGSPE